MSRVEEFTERHRPTKSWGFEEWIVNNDLYCGKRLHFTAKGGATSLHFHMKKHETMYIESGRFNVITHDPATGAMIEHDLWEGDSIVIEPGTPHRIICAGITIGHDAAIMVEFSTHHEDADSYRVFK